MMAIVKTTTKVSQEVSIHRFRLCHLELHHTTQQALCTLEKLVDLQYRIFSVMDAIPLNKAHVEMSLMKLLFQNLW
jgi:hypothetical protein